MMNGNGQKSDSIIVLVTPIYRKFSFTKNWISQTTEQKKFSITTEQKKFSITTTTTENTVTGMLLN